MATFDILLVLLLGVIVFGAIASIANYLIGGYHLLVVDEEAKRLI